MISPGPGYIYLKISNYLPAGAKTKIRQINNCLFNIMGYKQDSFCLQQIDVIKSWSSHLVCCPGNQRVRLEQYAGFRAKTGPGRCAVSCRRRVRGDMSWHNPLQAHEAEIMEGPPSSFCIFAAQIEQTKGNFPGCEPGKRAAS